MITIDIKELIDFLEMNPQMSLVPSDANVLVIKGELPLEVKNSTYGDISDSFLIKIIIPSGFPKEIPTIFELEDRFPKTADYHTFQDSSLCLGSPLSIMKRLKDEPTLEGYIKLCVIPYFYAIALKLRGNDSFIFGELSHGSIGIIEDYFHIFNLDKIEKVIQLLEILSLKPNIGNKMNCPCGCGCVVTKCSLHKKIVEYRDVISRKEFKEHKKVTVQIYYEIKRILEKNSYRKPIPYA